jgi:hypothetical protein
MKKFAKMSLVAAVAVAGMTTANAKDLTEAIKGVDVSGTIVYRYEDYEDRAGSNDGATSTDDSARNRYKVGISVKSPVNDDVTANTRFLVASGSGNFVDLGSSEQADSNPEVTLSQVNFAYTGIQNTTVSVGKLGVQTPWTNAIDADGSEQTGTGILAASTWGPVTGVAGYLNQTNFTAKTGGDVAVGGLIAAIGPVNAEAWYIDLDEEEDSYFVKASASFDISGVKLGVFAQHSDTDEDDSNDDLSLTKAGITAKVGMFNAGVTYGETGKEGTGTADKNSLAKSGMVGWNQTLHGEEDASMLQLDLGMQVTPELHVGLNYDAIDQDLATEEDSEETFVQVTYKMSKNFMTYVRFGDYDLDNAADGADGTRGRLHVQYTF